VTERSRKHVIFDEDDPLESRIMTHNNDIPSHLRLEFDKNKILAELNVNISHTAIEGSFSGNDVINVEQSEDSHS